MQTLEPIVSVSFKNILLATDLSPASENALQYAQAFAREHAAVHTLHVSGSDNYQLLCPEAFSATFNAPRDYRAGTKVLRGLLEGLPCEVPVHGTRIWEVIADVADRNEIDLLIVGTHGRRGVQKLLFGSVAEEVLRDVACPVLTVGPEVKIPDSAGFKIDKILLATDCSPDSLAPVHASWLCEHFNAAMVALHVTGNSDGGLTNTFQLQDSLVAIAPLINQLSKQPNFTVEAGEPASKILQVARELGADLIVLGAHAPRDVRAASHLPWATAARVIAGARCPVWTVRDPAPSSWD
jgi:nucleotide-binding universal stress UspA family protein